VQRKTGESLPLTTGINNDQFPTSAFTGWQSLGALDEGIVFAKQRWCEDCGVVAEKITNPPLPAQADLAVAHFANS